MRTISVARSVDAVAVNMHLSDHIFCVLVLDYMLTLLSVILLLVHTIVIFLKKPPT